MWLSTYVACGRRRKIFLLPSNAYCSRNGTTQLVGRSGQGSIPGMRQRAHHSKVSVVLFRGIEFREFHGVLSALVFDTSHVFFFEFSPSADKIAY